ncbi:unnamed protein product [Adineta steineri]|uniref:Uncharacterized protein n=1 Tax=Adineta steineri TaxID=433720 RepID=A0A815L0B1_9BILA|nr:unnamed protein product [Adineta steineri]CAF1399782.1 unnamed protein product [Adineta steineri]
MAMANNKTLCSICNKDKITYPCKGCSKEFCLMDLTEHRQILNAELHRVTNEYNEFKQRINEQKQNPHNHSLIKQIDQWEINSIKKIQQKAQDLEYLTNQLMKITQELNNLSNMSIQQNLQPFINQISIIITEKPKFNKWKQNAITVAAGNECGHELNQLNLPFAMFIDKKKNIFIADFQNHRIVEWKSNAKEGQITAGGNNAGYRMDQLHYPRDVIVDQQNHSVIIADSENRRVIQWSRQN